VEDGGNRHMWPYVVRVSAPVGHVPVSKIYSQERGGRAEEQLVVERSRISPYHGGAARVKVKLPEVDKYDFEEMKSKNFKRGQIRG
jgi:hypothetical protein